jgi:hypothetical protein
MMDALFADGDAPHVNRTRTRASIPISCLIPTSPGGWTGTSIRVAVVLRRLTVIFRSSKPILRGEIQLTRRAVSF